MARQARVPGTWLAALAAAAAGVPTLLYPLGRDQGIYLLIGQGVAHGAFPYRDLWDFKPPGLFLAYALPALLGGGAAWPVAALDLAALVASVVLLGGLARRGGYPAAGGAAAVLLTGLWLFAADFWDTGQAERLAIPLVLATLLLLLASSATPRRWLAAGSLLGIAVVLKYSMLPLALLVLPFWIYQRRRAPGAAVALATGMALPALAVAVWLFAGGALGPGWKASVVFAGDYSRLAWADGGTLLRTAAGTTLYFLRSQWPLILLAAVGCTDGRRAAASGSGAATVGLRAPLLLLLAGGYLSILVQGKFFPYHWAVLWGPLALLGGMGAARLAELAAGLLARPRARPALAAGHAMALLPALLAALLPLLAGAPGLQGWWLSARRLAGQVSTARHLAGFKVQGMGYDELTAAVAHATATTTPGTPLYLWGFEPAFYVMAGRPFPGRFPFSYPLVSPWAPPEWRQEFLAAFTLDPPELVLVRRGDPIPWVAGIGGDASTRLHRFPEFEAILHRDYRPDATASSTHLHAWRRLAPPASHH